MSVGPDLFIGLVTHPRTRFPEAAGAEGLMAQVAQGAREAGLAVVTAVSDQDAWSLELLPIDRAEVLKSIDAELDAERRWRAYLNDGAEPWWLATFMSARRAYRRLRLMPPWRSLGESDAGTRMVRRLANIELSHLRVIDSALVSKAPWSLIVEDDAAGADGERFGRELAAFLRLHANDEQPAMVTLSESFSLDDLGIRQLLTPIDAASAPWPVLAAERPVSNTVCATLYRRDFLVRLRQALTAIPLSPVVPIDFKLNEALMALATTMRAGDVWVAAPAPLVQRSGVPVVRL